jgi:hypothetical protein
MNVAVGAERQQRPSPTAEAGSRRSCALQACRNRRSVAAGSRESGRELIRVRDASGVRGGGRRPITEREPGLCEALWGLWTGDSCRSDVCVQMDDADTGTVV